MHGILNNQDCRLSFLMHEYLYTVRTGRKILTFRKVDITYVRSAGVVWWPPFMIRIGGSLENFNPTCFGHFIESQVG